MKRKLILEELIDINECAAIFKFSVGRLRKMCMNKQIPYYKFGRNVLFYKPEIAKWIESNKVA